MTEEFSGDAIAGHVTADINGYFIALESEESRRISFEFVVGTIAGLELLNEFFCGNVVESF